MLSNAEIRKEMELGNIVITPFNPANLGANSYDICLGNYFIPLLGYTHETGPCFGGFFYVADGELIEVPIGGTLLAMTKEIAGSKHDLIPMLKTRSSVRRNGIDICASAGLGDIGYINHWTIELTALISTPMSFEGHFVNPFLEVGSRIGQLVFERAGLPANPPYAGQYNSTEWPLCMLPKDKRSEYEGVDFTPRGRMKKFDNYP